MKQWWLIGLLALALTMSACGKDDKDSKEAVVAKKPHKKKRRKRRKRKRSAKKGDKDAKDSAKKGDKKTAQAKKGVADVKGEKGRAKAGGDADAPADTGKKARPPRPSKMAAKGAPTPEAVAADAAKALAEARKAAKANAAAPGAPDPAEAAKAAAVAPAAAAPAVAAAAAPAGEVPVAAKGAAEAAAKAADAAKAAEAAKAADAAKAANAAAEAQAAERQAAVLRGRPPEPSLDISGYLSAADLERVLGKKWKFQRADLSGIKPNKGYNAVYYARGGRKGRFGVSLQVWRDLNLVDSRTRFNTMKNTYTDVVATNKVREQGFRAYYGGVVSLVFVDPRRPLLASVSCATKVCKADALIELSRRVAERLR